MEYTQSGDFIIAHNGYVFQPKFTTGILPKMIFADSIDNYDLIPEPEQQDDINNDTEETNGELEDVDN